MANSVNPDEMAHLHCLQMWLVYRAERVKMQVGLQVFASHHILSTNILFNLGIQKIVEQIV